MEKQTQITVKKNDVNQICTILDTLARMYSVTVVYTTKWGMVNAVITVKFEGKEDNVNNVMMVVSSHAR